MHVACPERLMVPSRLLPTVLLTVILFSFSACSGDVDSSPVEPSPVVSATPIAEPALDEVERSTPTPAGASALVEGVERVGADDDEPSSNVSAGESEDEGVVETAIDEPASAAKASPSSNSNLLTDTTNILILGSDRRPDTPNWRTDVMMIVAMDRENGRAGVISVPRDLFIEDIPGHDPNRINVVDYLGELDEPDGGGPALLSTIIEERMGVPIHHFLRFNFDSFREVVDALDGVNVDIDCEFRGFVEEEGGWLVLEPGINRLSGNEAMIYVRDRQLTGGDLNRARRQQRFVWAVRNQILNENLLPKLPALYSALSDSIETNIGLVTTLRLARLALDLDPDDLYGMVVGPPEMAEMGWAMGMSVFLPDWDKIAENVQLIFDSPPFAIDNTPEHCRPISED